MGLELRFHIGWSNGVVDRGSRPSEAGLIPWPDLSIGRYRERIVLQTAAVNERTRSVRYGFAQTLCLQRDSFSSVRDVFEIAPGDDVAVTTRTSSLLANAFGISCSDWLDGGVAVRLAIRGKK